MEANEPLDATADVLVVNQWHRYGRHRAYVELNGASIGYRDLQSGDVVCDDPRHEPLIGRATESAAIKARAARYAPRHAAAVGELAVGDTAPEPPAVSRLEPDRDLALNRPGEAARAQALALRDDAPFGTFIARCLGVKTAERAWRIGADAEVEVAHRLEKLGPEWHVLHAVPVGDKGSDIDHVVIGPAGVFTLNTKHHPNARVWVYDSTFKVNGQNQRYIHNSRHEADRAARLLSARAAFKVEVQGLIVVVGAVRGFKVKAQPADGAVRVVPRRRVASELKDLPRILDEVTVERVFEIARHLATWQPKTAAWMDF